MPAEVESRVEGRVFIFAASLPDADAAATAAADLWQRARDFLAANGIDKTAAYSVRMWLEELLTNLAKYGIPPGAATVRTDGRIECGVDGKVRLTLIDDGVPFDPSQVVGQDLEASVEERSIGGLGLQLLFARFSGFAYAREAGRNRGEWLLAATERSAEVRE